MPTVEERVAYLEGRLEDHATAFDDLRASARTTDNRIIALDSKIEAVARTTDGRIIALDSKIDRLFYELESRLSRQFTWIVGIQVTILLAIIGTLVTSSR